MQGLEHDVLNLQDLNLLHETSLELKQKGFESFADMFTTTTSRNTVNDNDQDETNHETDREKTCDGIAFEKLIKRASDHTSMCPPTRTRNGMEDYKDDFSFNKTVKEARSSELKNETKQETEHFLNK